MKDELGPALEAQLQQSGGPDPTGDRAAVFDYFDASARLSLDRVPHSPE